MHHHRWEARAVRPLAAPPGHRVHDRLRAAPPRSAVRATGMSSPSPDKQPGSGGVAAPPGPASFNAEETTISLLITTDLRTDGGTQPRVRLDDTVIERYAEEMQAGLWDFSKSSALITVFHDGENYWALRRLSPGWQRRTRRPSMRSRSTSDKMAGATRSSTRSAPTRRIGYLGHMRTSGELCPGF